MTRKILIDLGIKYLNAELHSNTLKGYYGACPYVFIIKLDEIDAIFRILFHKCDSQFISTLLS